MVAFALPSGAPGRAAATLEAPARIAVWRFLICSVDSTRLTISYADLARSPGSAQQEPIFMESDPIFWSQIGIQPQASAPRGEILDPDVPELDRLVVPEKADVA